MSDAIETLRREIEALDERLIALFAERIRLAGELGIEKARRSVPIERIAAVTSANVARLYGIPNKGRIAPGLDADLILVDPDLERRVDPDALESYSDYSTYEGKVFRGWPTGTWVRGRKIAADGAILPEVADDPGGCFIVRTGATAQALKA